MGGREAVKRVGKKQSVNERETEQVRRRIEEILENEHPATVLSELLFSPSGLFSRLATTEAERRQLVQTPLFRRGRARLTEIQRREADAFRRELEKYETIARASAEPVAAGQESRRAQASSKQRGVCE
jgi:hypothetical protein